MRIGILGYGQLGRMLAMAGIPLGFSFSFYEAQTQSLYRSLVPQEGPVMQGPGAFETFLNEVQIVTYETENTPELLIQAVASQKSLYPGPEGLLVTQNRIREKTYCQALKIPVTPFRAVHSLADCQEAAVVLGFPLVLKTITMGYDGKGQWVVHRTEELASAWRALNSPQLIAEAWVPFEHECSLMVVRDQANGQSFYPMVENTHRKGILRSSVVRPQHPFTAQAQEIASRLVEEFQYVGLLTVEFFVTAQGLLVNEIAPRVHNSGHWTIEGATTSQFANHLRAMAGLPLGATTLRSPYVGMVNLLGDIGDLERLLEVEGACVYVYGKTPQPNRKMGHVTFVAESAECLALSMARIQALIL